jgi:hypothetical protein
MAELTVRQNELVVTVEPREKQRLTWFGLRTSRTKVLDGLELRVPLAEVTGVHVGDAYWELPEQMDARDNVRATTTRGGTAEPSQTQPWIGIFPVTHDGVTKKKLCFIHGQHSPVVAVDLDASADAPFTALVVSCLPYETGPLAASIKAAAGLT